MRNLLLLAALGSGCEPDSINPCEQTDAEEEIYYKDTNMNGCLDDEDECLRIDASASNYKVRVRSTLSQGYLKAVKSCEPEEHNI